jgi:hypothetical protein
VEVTFVNWLLFALLGTGGWLMKRTLDRVERQVDENQKDTQKIREEYLHKSEFKDFKYELRGMFEELKQDIRSLQK